MRELDTGATEVRSDLLRSSAPTPHAPDKGENLCWLHTEG